MAALNGCRENEGGSTSGAPARPPSNTPPQAPPPVGWESLGGKLHDELTQANAFAQQRRECPGTPWGSRFESVTRAEDVCGLVYAAKPLALAEGNTKAAMRVALQQLLTLPQDQFAPSLRPETTLDVTELGAKGPRSLAQELSPWSLAPSSTLAAQIVQLIEELMTGRPQLRLLRARARFPGRRVVGLAVVDPAQRRGILFYEQLMQASSGRRVSKKHSQPGTAPSPTQR